MLGKGVCGDVIKLYLNLPLVSEREEKVVY